MHEASEHADSSFLTLTYRPETLPADGGLVVRDLQLFMKRLRKRVGKARFYACGEYGEQTKRPHYHVCLFGQGFRSDRSPLKSQNGYTLYSSGLLEAVWQLGHCSVGDLTRESAQYVAGYSMKKLGGDQGEREYTRFDPATGECWSVRPPFATMSRNPGIGSSWIDKFQTDVYPSDEVVLNGKSFHPPRYYDEKLGEAELAEIKSARRERMRQSIEEYSIERLAVRESVVKARVGLSQRDSI